MAKTAADLKRQAHALIDRMAPGRIFAAVEVLERMLDPVERSLAQAPYDDEPVSEEEARQLEAASASLARGEGVSHEEVLAEYGLTLEDFERMGRTPLESDTADR
jgi:hypothetical protein